ncbi:MAG: response regulator transcription factor [Eubacteriales bacterium]|nr:response regulator transcription factor [Eubacteriales bacterium]
MADIIVVEDNEEIGSLLTDFLIAEGYDVYLASSGEEGLEIFEDEGAKLVILDIMLSGIDGFAVCSKIWENSNTPIIIVSAKDTKDDKLNGILLGADDYIEKPYDIDLLIAKVNGIFQRRYKVDSLVCGDIRLNPVGRQVYKKGKLLNVTVKEFDLLLYMMENRDTVLTKESLFAKIWGFDSESELQTLTVHIKWLREKIEDDPKNPLYIQTVWGVGYRFSDVERGIK